MTTVGDVMEAALCSLRVHKACLCCVNTDKPAVVRTAVGGCALTVRFVPYCTTQFPLCTTGRCANSCGWLCIDRPLRAVLHHTIPSLHNCGWLCIDRPLRAVLHHTIPSLHKSVTAYSAVSTLTSRPLCKQLWVAVHCPSASCRAAPHNSLSAQFLRTGPTGTEVFYRWWGWLDGVGVYPVRPTLCFLAGVHLRVVMHFPGEECCLGRWVSSYSLLGSLCNPSHHSGYPAVNPNPELDTLRFHSKMCLGGGGGGGQIDCDKADISHSTVARRGAAVHCTRDGEIPGSRRDYGIVALEMVTSSLRH
ncbi:hypothetical protein J6590_047420 [Homalodisca vitripennis]|nr:hypothetical protein J6590_047420 [Homalodisca vitripennis]